MAAAVGGLPFLVFTTFAGVFIDKMDKRKLLVRTQVAEAFSAILLGVLVVTGNINLPLVLVLAVFHGMILTTTAMAQNISLFAWKHKMLIMIERKFVSRDQDVLKSLGVHGQEALDKVQVIRPVVRPKTFTVIRHVLLAA